MGAAFPLAVLALWELLSRGGVLAEDGFSRPSRFFVAGAKALADGTLLAQTAQTFGAAAQALVIATVAGVTVGAILGLFRPLERAAQLTIDALRPIPSVALIPLSLLIFGFSREMSAAVAAFACFWPILIVTTAAVRGVDPRLIEVGRLLAFPLPKIVLKLALPAALPGILVGIRVAAGIAIVVTVTTEIVTNPRGLGYAMTMAAESLQPDLVWATLLWVGVVGWAANWALEKLPIRR
ncbi:MAG: ABC transporter permease subunit [Betaproteobacteria bacterium]|nr:ABC transporter permease subunit [Betaproteobacteria bacterium]